MNLKKFIIWVITIFLIERVLQTLGLPVTLFPIFVIWLALRGEDLLPISWVIISSLFFDLFSGFPFGFATLAILLVWLTIYLVGKRLNLYSSSIISRVLFTTIFVIEYFGIIWLMIRLHI